MTRETVLITGATVGIGESFSRLLASQGYDLVLVARDEVRLNERATFLREKFSINVEVLRADLTIANDCQKVENRLCDETSPITVLINNAGFGIKSSFTVSALKDEADLLDVLVRAPMHLMHAAIPGMLHRGSGTIINVSSIGGWIAGGTYSAAKSYLTTLSESLHTQLQGTGVTVTALCPGYTRTQFHERGGMRMSGLPDFMWLSSDRVAGDGWKAAKSGKALSIPGWLYLILSGITRYGPRPWIRKLGMNVRLGQRKKS